MGLISKTTKIKWNGTIRKRYEDLGYIYTKMGDKFEVKVEDLTKGSGAIVKCICDNCNKELFWSYSKYNEYVKEDGKTYCNKCSIKLFGRTKKNKTRVQNSKSLGEYIVEKNGEKFLQKAWSDKNGFSPFEITYKSGKICWWKCLEGIHEDYQRTCHNSTAYDYRCPECSKERNESFYEEEVRTYLTILSNIFKLSYYTEYNCTFIPKNPRTNFPLPFDNEIILENGKHLIIEVHGEQHYKNDFYKYLFKCSEEEATKKLLERQYLDDFKKEECLKNNFNYLVISYKDFKEDLFINIINNELFKISDYNNKECFLNIIKEELAIVDWDKIKEAISNKEVVIYDNNKFGSVKSFVKWYNNKHTNKLTESTVWGYLSGRIPMRRDLYDKGLRYTNNKMSDYNFQKGFPKGENVHNSQKVFDVTNCIIYSCQRECCESIKIDKTEIFRYLDKNILYKNNILLVRSNLKIEEFSKSNIKLTKEEIILLEFYRNIKHKNRRVVYCKEFSDVLYTPSKWGKELKITPSNINAVCGGKKDSIKGYHFSYATEEQIKEYEQQLLSQLPEGCFLKTFPEYIDLYRKGTILEVKND